MIDKPREVALKIMYKVEKEKAYSNIVLNELINENRKILTNKDIGFIAQIVYGTISWKLTIDEIILKYSKIKIKNISDMILNILRISIYQIVFLDKVPKSAAVNEGVNLAKRYGHKASSSFVNAILRKVEKEDYLEFARIKDDAERISKMYSMPIWIIQELVKEKNIKEVEEICMNSNISPKLSIRINRLKTNKKELIKKLEEKEIEVKNGLLEDFLIVSNIRNIENLQEFKNGLFTVQDEVAAIPSIVLDSKENECILDICSAPGGKTTYIAELINNKGKIIAGDIHEHRIKLVEENCKRLGIENVEVVLQDATKYEEKYFEKFDKILLDVPCMGIGVLKRKPDIKWQRKKEDLENLKKIQKAILENCSKYLKKDGIMVYSTCSILKSENEDIVNQFILENNQFNIEKIELENINEFEKYLENEKFLKVYQNINTDGFFIAKIKKPRK